MPKSLREFLAFARTDAALQERIAAALEGPAPSLTVVGIAGAAGWSLQEEAVQAELAAMAGDHEMERVVGGFADKEWFAEGVSFRPKIKGTD